MRCARIRRSIFTTCAAGDAPPPADLIILPGSKNVQRDLAWLRAQGWDAAIATASALRRQA